MVIQIEVWAGRAADNDPGDPSYWRFRTFLESDEGRNAIGRTLDYSRLRYTRSNVKLELAGEAS